MQDLFGECFWRIAALGKPPRPLAYVEYATRPWRLPYTRSSSKSIAPNREPLVFGTNSGSINEPPIRCSFFCEERGGDRSIGGANLRKGAALQWLAHLAPVRGASPFYGCGPAAPFNGSGPAVGWLSFQRKRYCRIFVSFFSWRGRLFCEYFAFFYLTVKF